MATCNEAYCSLQFASQLSCARTTMIKWDT